MISDLIFVFCTIGYVLAGFAVSGLYDGLHDNDMGPLIGPVWPLYIAWLPGQAVYKAVKAQASEQAKRAKKAKEASVPPGKSRLNRCETCVFGLTGDAKRMRFCGLKEKWVENEGWCKSYKEERKRQ